MNEQMVFGKFRVRLHKHSTQLPPPVEGTSDTYIYPEALHAPSVRYGVLATNPRDDTDIIIAVTGPRAVLEHLGGLEGVTALSERDAETLMQEWRPHA